MRSGLAQEGRQAHKGAHRGRSRKQSAPQRSCLDSGLNQDLSKKSSSHAEHSSSPKQKHDTVHAHDAHDVVLEAPSIPALPVPSAPIAQFELAADAAAAQHAVKKRKSRVRHAPKTGCCSFCFATESPMWRNGPEPYPRLCNACGMRYFRCMAKKPPQDPFSAKILANMLRKAAKAGKSSSAALTAGTNHPALAHPNISAAVKPKQARKHSQRSKAAVQAAPAVAASADHAPAQRAPGKRARKASAKALAYEEELREQELLRHSKVARRPQQQQQHGYEDAVSWDMSEDPAVTDSPSEAEAEDAGEGSMQEEAAAGSEPQEHQQQSAANTEQHGAGAHASEQVAAAAAAKLVALAQAILQEKAKLMQAPQHDSQHSLQEGHERKVAAAAHAAGGSAHGMSGQHMDGGHMSPHNNGSLHHLSSLDSAATG